MTLTEADYKAIRTIIADVVRDELKPLKADVAELKADVAELKADVAELKADVAELKTTVNRGFATDADNLAKTVTVAILHGDTIHGHGLVDTIHGHGLVVVKDGAYHLLSAAHVIVGLTLVCLQWSAAPDRVWEVDVQGIYLDENYILHGSHDIGAMVLGKGPEFPKKVVNVKCSEGNQVGKLAVGHGLVYLSGSIILDEVDNSPRSMINAIPVGGGSGCPLFIQDDDGVSNHHATLFSLLHGESEHRHWRVAVEHTSNRVFADKLRYRANELQLKRVLPYANVLAALRKAEELVPMNALEVDEQYALVSSDCPEVIQNIAKELQVDLSGTVRFSTNQIMDLLAREALPDQQPSLTLWDKSSTMTCVVPGTLGKL